MEKLLNYMSMQPDDTNLDVLVNLKVPVQSTHRVKHV